MIVSVLHGQVIFGVDYGSKGATVSQIDQKDVGKINDPDYVFNQSTMSFDYIVDQAKIDENQKKIYIQSAKEIAKEGEDLRMKYLSVELLPDSDLKTQKLQILHEKGQQVMSGYLQLESELVSKYGDEILNDLIS